MADSAPLAVWALLFAFGGGALVLAVHALARAVAGRIGAEGSTDLAGSVILRISALHGLILALVFAQELVRLDDVRGSALTEATALADVWNDADRWRDAAATAPLRAAVADYLALARGEEWRSLGEAGVLLAPAWAAWDAAYQTILDLRPADLRQEALREHMLRDVQRIAEMRQLRETSALRGVSGLFWGAALGGIVLVAALYFPFAPDGGHVAMLGAYGMFTGFVVFVIFVLSNPFADPGAIEPVAFDRIAELGVGAPAPD